MLPVFSELVELAKRPQQNDPKQTQLMPTAGWEQWKAHLVEYLDYRYALPEDVFDMDLAKEAYERGEDPEKLVNRWGAEHYYLVVQESQQRASEVRQKLRSPWERLRGRKIIVPGTEFEGESIMKDETTYAGLMEAALSGDLSTEELLQSLEENPQLDEQDPAATAMNRFKKMSKKGPLPGANGDEEEEATGGMGCPMPRRKKARSRFRPQAGGAGPVRRPTESCDCSDCEHGEGSDECGTCKKKKRKDHDESAVAGSFEAMVAEGCGLKNKKGKKKKKTKKKKMKASESERPSKKGAILEFAAPERQDVIRWARGSDPQRIGEGKTPFWFDGDDMISHNIVIARRNLAEKKAQVLHPQKLSAFVGRHSVLANQGLRYAGYNVEVVDEL